MINEQGLWQGNRVRVLDNLRNDEVKFFTVLVYRHIVVADFAEKAWANAFAELVESLIPLHVSGSDSALKYVHEGLLSLLGTRYLVAGVLERAAEKHQARALEALDDRERGQCSRAAHELREQAKLLREAAG